MKLEIQDLAWGRHKNVEKLNWFEMKMICIICLFSFLYPRSNGGGYAVLLYPRSTPQGGILFYLCPSFRPSKIFFVTFFSATIDDRNLIFGQKLHIGMPYCGKRFFFTRQIPTCCLLI